MRRAASTIHLGVEGGGTKTTAVALDENLALVEKAGFGPGNLRLLSDKALSDLFRQIASAFSKPASIGICLAGLRTEQDAGRVRKIAGKIWPNVPIHTGHDLEAALAAADTRKAEGTASVLVLSGTGSCCYGRTAEGRESKLGGWGHLLGDRGSGYHIGLRALQEVAFHFDRDGGWSRLGERILRRLLLNSPEDLIAFVQSAEKHAIADLAPEVFAAAEDTDRIAQQILRDAAQSLASDALRCAARLARGKEPVRFVLAGSVLIRQSRFSKAVSRLIRKEWRTASCTVLANEGAVGAARLGMRVASLATSKPSFSPRKTRQEVFIPPLDPASPTERRNPASMKFDQMPLDHAVDLMLGEEAKVIPALRRRNREIVRGVGMVAEALQKGCRIFYVGAGTSGRLGVLDASECPPTFSAEPDQIQGIIAGGNRALWQAAEGAEDSNSAGGQAIRFRGVNRGDVVVGIAASGRTPFVWGALAEARKRGARTILLCFNPNLVIPKEHRPDLVISPDLGPEVLTGSTRLKSGTATKLVLNMFSTIAMTRAGKVVSNLMVDLNPSNVKLRDRAIRIVRELCECSPEAARDALEKCGWVVKKAWEKLSH